MIKLFTAGLLSLVLHTHNTSVCDIAYNAKNETLEVVQQVFIEDLEHTLTEINALRIDVYGDDKTVVEKYLKQFMEEHLSFSADGQEFTQKWVGYKIDRGYLKMFVEVPVGHIHTLTVGNTIFLKSHGAQENIVHLKSGGITKSGVCRKGHETVTFEL